MTAGDKLYFAQVKDGAAAFTVDQIVLFQNKNSLFDNSLSVQKEGSIINVGVLWTLLFTRPLVLR